MYINKIIFIVILLLDVFDLSAQSKKDSILGSNNELRSWWDVKHYSITIRPDFKTKSIKGLNDISFILLNKKSNELQLDLQSPMKIDSVFCNSIKLNSLISNGNFWILNVPSLKIDTIQHLKVYFSGLPRVAKNAPWDGGWVWKLDSNRNPWMSVACQGAGASVWYPCKDLQSDEPENGAELNIQVPDTLVGIGNGQLQSILKLNNGYTQYSWKVINTINSYNIVPYIGKYKLISDSIVGRKGFLKTNYWFLEYNEAKAKLHLRENVIKTIKSLEDWFGPYPFYEDSYKIVESPYLGMEHQSNIAYGNNYLNGYAGRDLSNSGWGLKWDFIVVHETAHEWYGNSITAYDIADNWIHEGFASYAEVLHTETFFGKDAGNSYCLGVRKSILNDKPIIGVYNVRQEGSGDMYNKGSNIIHMIRYLLDDDIKFKSLLNVISTQFYHQCITSKQLEDFIMSETKLDLNAFFNQYLRTTQIPKLEYRIKGKLIEYRFINIVNGFTAPIKIYVNQDSITLNPNNNWQKLKLNERVRKTEISFDNRMYVETIRVR